MIQLLVNGLSLGAIYALAAIGFVLIFNVSGAVNFSHGALVLLGGFLGVAISAAIGGPVMLTLILVALAMGALGVVLERVAFRPLQDKPFVAVFISTLAIGIIISNLILLLWGPQPRSGTPLAAGAVKIGGTTIPWQSAIIVTLTLAIVVVQWCVFHRTTIGAKLRATAEDAPTAELMGIRTTRVRMLVFGFAAALAGVAGMLIGPVAFLDPGGGGIDIILKIYIAVVIGGFGSELGAVAGGLLLGLAEVLTAGYLTSSYRDVVVFGILILFLTVRPEGLFGKRTLREA